MKKIISFVFIIAALVFAASCINERVSLEEGDGVFTLRLQTAALETRADDAPTEEEIENIVTHADFFFFSDAEGTTLLNHTRLEVKEGELVAKSDNIYEYKFNVSSEGNHLQKTSYLYVIANYPETISAETLADILALDIKTDLSGDFTSFVMDSYDSSNNGKVMTKLTPSQPNDNKEVTIGLTRAAAKLVLKINVIDSCEDAAKNVWTPETSQMWVNFVNARKTAIVEAAPVDFDVKTNYFNTEQETPVSITAAKEDYTSWKTSAVYTYPQNYTTDDVHAPYYKIFCPWTCDKYGMSNFYYKIILPDLTSFQRNKVYNLTVDISTIGGKEEEWALVADYIYVADWWAPEKIEATFEGAMYLDVPVKHYDIFGIVYVDVPVVSSNDIQVNGITVSGTVNGTKTNLYSGGTKSVSATVKDITKDGFKLEHVLNTDMTSEDFDCTPITYTVTVKHTTGGLTKAIDVTIVQYPSIYAEADASNGYAYVNSYAYTRNHGGNYSSGYSYNSRQSGAQSLGQMNQVGSSQSTNNNSNQYVVHVSVLPEGYRVTGLDEDVVIGDPRGGTLAENNLGITGSGASNTVDRIVQASYKAVSSSTQNVIAPALRIASSWGATTFDFTNFDRAEERCAAYQENGYPAGRWRMPTIAEIDFLILLSTYEHIPALFTTQRVSSGGYNSYYYFRSYWAGGKYLYCGKPYTDNGHLAPFENMESASVYNTSYLRLTLSGNTYTYAPGIRCVYDEWYWGDQKYGNNGQSSTTAATQWIGYKF